MASRPYMEHELLAEIFESVPEHGLNDLYQLSNTLSYKCIEGIADRLTVAYPEKRREIEAALEKYEISVEKELDTSFNTLQQYASQVVWHIPSTLDIQLDHYKQLAMKDTEEINQQLDQLRQKILTQKKLKSVLQYENEKLIRQNKELDDNLQSLAFMSNIPKHEQVPDPIKDSTFIKDQLDIMTADMTKLTLALDKQKTTGQTHLSSEMEQTERVRAKIDAKIDALLDQTREE
ncbi:hypothetical protein BD560DRAFT_381009 [Blakeslea trispora]|nr:hypothetical protein BD560DRAFT_381009 [Blakeslea trispora]